MPGSPSRRSIRAVGESVVLGPVVNGPHLRELVAGAFELEVGDEQLLGLVAGRDGLNVGRLLTRSPAPTTSTTARATSTTSISWREVARLPAAEWPPSARSSRGARRVARRAGRMPKTSPVRADAASAKTSTGVSIEALARRGSDVGAAAFNTLTPAMASTSPAAPPTLASTRLSVTSCLAMRAALAPSDCRMANSRARPVRGPARGAPHSRTR